MAHMGFWRFHAMTSSAGPGTDDDVDAESDARVAGHGGKMWRWKRTWEVTWHRGGGFGHDVTVTGR